MKSFLINKVTDALVILTAIFILGIFVPIAFSILLTIFSDTTFNECTMSVPFWIFTVIGVVISACYISHLIEERDNDSNTTVINNTIINK